MATADPWAAFNPQPADAPPAAAAAPSAGADPWAAFNPQPAQDASPAPPVSTAADVGKGFVSGVGSVTQVPSALVGAGDWLARQAVKAQYGVTDEEIDKRVAEAKAKGQWSDTPRAIADPISQAAGAGFNAAVAPLVGPNSIQYQPQTGAGEAAQLGGAFLPGAIGGEAGVAPLASRLVTRAAIPAAGAFAGGKIAEGVGADKTAGQAIGGLAAGILPHLPPVSTVGEALIPSVDPELAAAAERHGWQAPVGLASESGPVQFLGRTGQSLPIGGAPLENSYRRLYEQMGATARSEAEKAGATSIPEAGGLVTNALQDWNSGMSPKVSAAFEGTRGMIDQQASTIPLDTTRGIAQDIATKYAGMRQPMPPSVQKVLDAVTDPNGLNFNGITDLRTMIGKLKNNWGQVTAQGMNTAELERLYGGLTQDAQASALAGGGQPAVDAWNSAKEMQKSVAGRRQAIGDVIGLQGDKAPEAVMAKLQAMAGTGSKADIDTLQQIRGMIGNDDWSKIAGTMAQGMGFNPQTNQFSLARLLSAYQKNLSDTGRDVIFGPAGSSGFRQAYDDLGLWAKRAHILDRYGNPSGTAQTIAGGELMTDAIFDPIRTIKGVVGSGGLSLLLARPATSSSLSRFTRTYQALTMAQKAGRATATGMRNLQGAARNLSNTAQAAGIQLNPDDLMRGLTSQPAAMPQGQGAQQ